MKTKKLNLMMVLGLLMSFALMGCSDDEGSPTAPPAPEEPSQTLYTTITATKLECLVDGDGAAGKGDFTFESNIAYGGEAWDRTMGTGETMTLNHKKRFTQTEYDGRVWNASITFRATEWDQDILGNVYADSDMNRLIAQASEPISPDMNKTNYITLGNSNCKVRLHYKIVSWVVIEAP